MWQQHGMQWFVGMRLLQRCKIQLQVISIDIHQYSRGTNMAYSFISGPEGDIWQGNAVPGSESKRYQRQGQGIGTIGTTDKMGNTGMPDEVGFEFPDVRATNETGIGKAACPVCQYCLLQGKQRRLEVDKGYCHRMPGNCVTNQKPSVATGVAFSNCFADKCAPVCILQGGYSV